LNILRISSYIRKPFLIYDFATDPPHLNFLIYEENFDFFFISGFYQRIHEGGMIGGGMGGGGLMKEDS
jgi:hypothetical protein